eukprot:8039078-Pyramimonas_sp.AAC.1
MERNDWSQEGGRDGMHSQDLPPYLQHVVECPKAHAALRGKGAVRFLKGPDPWFPRRSCALPREPGVRVALALGTPRRPEDGPRGP